MWEKAKSVQWVVRASARSEFDKLLAQTPAEILRVDMASVYMDLKDWPFPCFAMLLTWHCILIPGYSPQALGISKIVDFPLVRSSVTLLLCSSSSSEWENREIHWRHGVPNGVALYQHLSKSWWPVEHRGTSRNIVELDMTWYDWPESFAFSQGLRGNCQVDRPPREALEKAAHFLCRIGALDTKDAWASHPDLNKPSFVLVDIEALSKRSKDTWVESWLIILGH